MKWSWCLLFRAFWYGASFADLHGSFRMGMRSYALFTACWRRASFASSGDDVRLERVLDVIYKNRGTELFC